MRATVGCVILLRMKKALVVLALCVLGATALFAWANRAQIRALVPLLREAPGLPPAGEPLPFSLPDGFTARLYSSEVPGVRVLARDPRGTLLASLPGAGSVVALPDEDGDGVADAVYEVIKGLDRPHGIAFLCDAECVLYIAEEGAVRSYAYDADTRKAQLRETVAQLPENGGHATRTLLPHPDGRLLVSVGSSCNVCEERDDRRASILAIDVATKEVERFAWGLRNTVFMAIHPVTGEIWGTDMGRDHLGDDLPPEEINILREGGWYGWPWFYGKNVEDYNFSPNARPSFAQEAVPSHIDMQAHSAPLGLAFIPEEGWPEEYWHDLIVAFHGSWNRSVPTGYKLVRIDLDDRGNFLAAIDDFMTGFTSGRTVLGRPVDVLAEPGGTLYVSDDRAGAIYRITRDSME